MVPGTPGRAFTGIRTNLAAFSQSWRDQLGFFTSTHSGSSRSSPSSSAAGLEDPTGAVDAARDLEFPVVVKPNIGGSGAGITSYASLDELEAAEVELGVDGTALVQEQLRAEGDSIVRIEILDGRFLYAIRLLLMPGSFNLCPADYCELPGIAGGVSGRGLSVEGYEPPAEAIDDAAAPGARCGGTRGA